MHIHSRDKSPSLNFRFIIGYPPYKIQGFHMTQFESDLGHYTMIEIFELYLCGCNKVIQYLHDWYNYGSLRSISILFPNTWCSQNESSCSSNLRYKLRWSIVMSLTLNCYTHWRERYLKASNVNIITPCGCDKFSNRTVYRLMVFHIFDITRELLVWTRFRTILITIGIIESVKLNGQALLIVFKNKLSWTLIEIKTLLSMRSEIAYFCAITLNDLWKNSYFL